MKLILVPTDFSRASVNAVRYAATLATDIKAQLIILHVHDTAPLIITPQVVGVVEPSSDENAKLLLKKLKTEVEEQFGTKILAKTELRSGYILEEIETSAKKNHVDLIVMGMQGTNYLAERFLGSITTTLMHECKIPVLSIDRHVEYKPIHSIVIATDGLAANYKKILQPLKELSPKKTHIHVLHVAPALVTSEEEEATGFSRIEKALKETDHSFHFHSSNDVAGDINSFVNETKADLVVMMPRNHNIWDGILNEAATKKLAFHSKVPLLALHV